MSEMKYYIQPVILAGGGGSRLWPLSRGHYPKQFLSLRDDKSMLQQTLVRLNGFSNNIEIFKPSIITNEEQRFLVAEHARIIEQSLKEIILEPVARNTAPAITVAALRVDDPEAILLIMPSDHIISDIKKFHKQVEMAVEYATQDYLVTFGITPVKPETGYGYISIKNTLSDNVFEIDEFVEKPSLEVAEFYVKSANYYWNSGLFVFKASIWLDAIKKYEPIIYGQCVKAVNNGSMDGEFFRLGKDEFYASPDDSIDYAVMEKISEDADLKAALVTLDAGWSDVGSWSSVWGMREKDADLNSTHGDVITINTKNSIIHSDHKLVATIGCEDMIVVETSDAVLVADKSQSQKVKDVVSQLKSQGREECNLHRKVYRPWGSYEGLDTDDKFQVKRLIVNPGKKLSLQLHHKRAEHWIVVSGIATITVGDKVFDLQENESTFIPLGEKHRLENKQDTVLEVIEVQCGDYLGEDDIVRFDDDFGRVN